jgi:maltooligosyltrehalose trehalohydrolase
MSHQLDVWAPAARRVALVLGAETVEMSPSAGGWWTAVVESAGPGTRYAFRVDGGPPRPDPRSPSQPEGVHGPSEVVSHGAFAWRDSRWRGLPLPGSILYELHVGTFTPEGTFGSAALRLDHLVRLGVDAVELLPVAEFPGGRGWGYDTAALFAPHHAYGGPEGLKLLIDECHHRGLGVVMDVVYNHLGPSGNYLPEFGPYFTDRNHTEWGSAVNFDGPESEEVRRFVIDNALMWLHDYHCDGLRIDAAHAIADASPLHILEELATEVEALACHLRKPLFLIAESDLNDPRLVASRDRGGLGLNAAWADDWHHAVHSVLTGERKGYYADYGTMSDVGKALGQAWVYDGQWSSYRRRRRGRRPLGLLGHQFVVSTQNHDQIGNRAQGERLSQLTTTGRLKVAAALLLTGPFVPLLFQGEEWGDTNPFQYFADFDDPELRDAVTEGRRREFAGFGWSPEDIPDPTDPGTFERSKLDWDELSKPPHAEILAWYLQLIALRRADPAFSDPRLDHHEVTWDEAARWLQVRRGRYLICASLASAPLVIRLPDRSRMMAASDSSIRLADGELLLPPDTVAILDSQELQSARIGA